MDLSFFRRNRAPRAAHATDLATLLARAAVIQASSPTAQAQMQIEAKIFIAPALDACIALFADKNGSSSAGRIPARFAVLDAADLQTSSTTMKPPFTLAF